MMKKLRKNTVKRERKYKEKYEKIIRNFKI